MLKWDTIIHFDIYFNRYLIECIIIVSGQENKLVLCSSKDKFVLTQDVCVMCGAVGTDSEGCLIACAQCGQTYHPYCVNIKVNTSFFKHEIYRHV